MKALTTVSLVVLLAVFAVASLAILISVISQSTYTADSFFIELIENKADLTQGTAILKIKNPTPNNITVDLSKLTARSVLESGATPTESLQYFILKTIGYSENVTDYSQVCNPYQITDQNGTNYTNQNCSSNVATGWHWKNYTKNEFVPLVSEILKPNEAFTIKLVGTWKIKMGLNAREWFPKLDTGESNYEQSKWAWWNTSYSYRHQILENTTNEYPVSVNDTGKIGDQSIVWSLIKNESYVYCVNSGCLTGAYSIGNETNQKFWENETNNTNYGHVEGNSPRNVWDNNYIAVYHFKDGSGQNMTDSSQNNLTLGSNVDTWEWANNGTFGKGLNLAATSTNHFSRADTIYNVDNSYTMEIWINHNSITNANFQSIFGKSNSYNLYIKYFDTGQNKFECSQRSNSTWSTARSTTIPVAGTTYYIVCRLDSGNLSIWVNGIMEASVGVGSTFDSTDRFWMAKNPHDSGDTTPNAVIDEIRVSNVSRSDAYIRAMYSNGFGNLTSFVTEEGLALSESEAGSAMQDGIRASLGNDTIIYTDQQIYARYVNGTQQLARFDKVTKYGNQIWAFNYVNGSTPLTNMQNITPAFYVMEFANQTSSSTIRSAASNLINQTKTS